MYLKNKGLHSYVNENKYDVQNTTNAKAIFGIENIHDDNPLIIEKRNQLKKYFEALGKPNLISGVPGTLEPCTGIKIEDYNLIQQSGNIYIGMLEYEIIQNIITDENKYENILECNFSCDSELIKIDSSNGLTSLVNIEEFFPNEIEQIQENTDAEQEGEDILDERIKLLNSSLEELKDWRE